MLLAIALPRTSMTTRLAESFSIEAFVFDAYGTLFDVHSVIALAEALAPGRGSALSRLWRAKQLEYTWLTSLMGPPAAGATISLCDRSRARLCAGVARDRLGDDGARAAARRVSRARTVSRVAAALEALAPRPRWILSNGTLAMLEPLVRRSRPGAHLDGVLSVDAAGIFKPSPRVYQLAVDRLQLPAARIGFVSSNCWDAIGAKAFGFTTFWINRSGAPVDRHGPAPDRIIATLADLPPLLATGADR